MMMLVSKARGSTCGAMGKSGIFIFMRVGRELMVGYVICDEY